MAIHTVVINEVIWSPGENPSHRENRWPDPLPGPSANDQEMTPLEADIQGFIRVILEAFPLKVNWAKTELCTQKEGEHLKAFVECFIETFQSQTALNLEAPVHRNLILSALVGHFF